LKRQNELSHGGILSIELIQKEGRDNMRAITATAKGAESSISNANRCYGAGWWTPRLAGPVIAALIVRLVLLAIALARNGTSSLIDPDTATYLEPGRNLLLHGRFAVDGVPDLLRTPGYPLFLAITSLAGLHAAALANLILSTISVILVWKLGRAVLGDDHIALGAAWILAFEPISLNSSFVLMSEPLFLVLFLLSLERLVEFLRGGRLWVLTAAGLWLTAATFVRPAVYYLPIALAPGLFLALRRVPGLRWKAPAVLLISILPWLAAWQIRNRIETGYAGFSSIPDVNLYLIAPFLSVGTEHRSYADARSELLLGYPNFNEVWRRNGGQFYLSQPYLARHPEQTEWNQGQRLAFMHSEAIHAIRAHYGVSLRTYLKGIFRTLFELGEGAFNHLLNPNGMAHPLGSMEGQGVVHETLAVAETYPWIAAEKAAFGLVMMGLYLLAVRGALRCDMHDARFLLLLGTSLYLVAVSGFSIGEARYRHPMMPAVCILAAAGLPRKKDNSAASGHGTEVSAVVE
jgi:hypothetical protein